MTLEVALRHARAEFTLDVAFTAPLGLTALFGRSGAGKTSVVEAVAGLLRPDAARVVLDGRVLVDTDRGVFVPPHRRRIGYVFQEPRLFPHLRVAANLRYGARFAGGPDADAFDRVVALLGLAGLLDRRPAALSGGEKRRVAIGRALLSRPRLLLLDEPLTALDDARKAEIMPYLERLRDAAGVPMIYVSHSAAEIARLATTVVALDAGKVLRVGPALDVLADRAALRAAGVRGAGVVLEGRVTRHHPDGLSELAICGSPVTLPRMEVAPGASVRVRIEAHDVILARSRPEGLSALNIFAGHVVAVQPGSGPSVIVEIDIGGARLLARITRRSAEALGILPGVAAFAIVKTVSVARLDVGVFGPPRDAPPPA